MGKSKRPHDTAMQCSVQRETLTLGFRKTQPLQTESDNVQNLSHFQDCRLPLN